MRTTKGGVGGRDTGHFGWYRSSRWSCFDPPAQSGGTSPFGSFRLNRSVDGSVAYHQLRRLHCGFDVFPIASSAFERRIHRTD